MRNPGVIDGNNGIGIVLETDPRDHIVKPVKWNTATEVQGLTQPDRTLNKIVMVVTRIIKPDTGQIFIKDPNTGQVHEALID